MIFSTSEFDWTLYGAKCRKKRLDMGYQTAEAFVSSIFTRTRGLITAPILYKIEIGKQEPKAMTFVCLNLSLWGEPFPRDVINECSSPEFREVLEAYRPHYDPEAGYVHVVTTEENPWIPGKWARENTDSATETDEVKDFESVIDSVSDAPRQAHRAVEIAKALGEPPSLFRNTPIIPEKPAKGNE